MKILLYILIFSVLSSCAYPTTIFYVKNPSDKPISFKASVVKFSSAGQYLMTVPFTVSPKDSVLARQVGLKEGAKPTAWFIDFIINPVDGISTNDPKLSENWIKSTNKQGRPIYIFSLTKQ